jgi:hypothetical protein
MNSEEYELFVSININIRELGTHIQELNSILGGISNDIHAMKIEYTGKGQP